MCRRNMVSKYAGERPAAQASPMNSARSHPHAAARRADARLEARPASAIAQPRVRAHPAPLARWRAWPRRDAVAALATLAERIQAPPAPARDGLAADPSAAGGGPHSAERRAGHPGIAAESVCPAGCHRPDRLLTKVASAQSPLAQGW